MRTLVYIFVLSLTVLSTTHAQRTTETQLELDDVIITTNTTYLTEVQDTNTPTVVAQLQKEAAVYDVSNSKGFDKQVRETFEMVFRNNKGSIDAFYNSSGEIVSALENFRDVLLPGKVRDQVFKENENWQMTGNQYTSSYSAGDLIKRTYKIKLRNGNHKKDVVINLND
jgi:G3E family GTPase